LLGIVVEATGARLVQETVHARGLPLGRGEEAPDVYFIGVKGIVVGRGQIEDQFHSAVLPRRRI